MDRSLARLEVVSGKGAGMSVVVEDELLIGRNAEGAGRLAEDDEISRTHARVSVDGSGRCMIEDLGSTNGTFVNRQRISEPQVLAVGDTLELGGTMLVVRDLPAPAGSVTVEPTVINAPIATPLPTGQDVSAGSDASGIAPTSVPAPAELDAPEVAPIAVPPPAEPDVPDTAATPVPAAPVAPPPSLHLEVDFDAREVRITSAHDSEPVRLVFEDGRWQPVTPS